jgi:hypothetical protein
MTISSWLPLYLRKPLNQGDKLVLSPDLRWITEYALTDGYSESIRLNATYEVFERETVRAVDRGFATVCILRGCATQWQSRPALEVRLTIDWFESAAGLIPDREEEACWYVSPEGLLLGFSWRGESFTVHFEEPAPWQWVEDVPMRIGSLLSIENHSESVEAILIATLESFDDDARKAFRICAVPAHDMDSSYGFTTWITEPDGTPWAHFLSFANSGQESDHLVTLMVRY